MEGVAVFGRDEYAVSYSLLLETAIQLVKLTFFFFVLCAFALLIWSIRSRIVSVSLQLRNYKSTGQIHSSTFLFIDVNALTLLICCIKFKYSSLVTVPHCSPAVYSLVRDGIARICIYSRRPSTCST